MHKEIKKPDCAEFIVAAIQEIRPKKIVPPGVRLEYIAELTLQVYSEEEFRESLQQLIDRKCVVATCLRIPRTKSEGSWESGESTYVAIRKFPKEVALLRPRWDWDSEENIADKNVAYMYYHCLRPKLYVAKDGLPKKVQALWKPKGSKTTTAWTIIEKMQK